MTFAGLIGVSVIGVFVAGTLVFAFLRLLLTNWCPACSGRGYRTDDRPARRCDVCAGTGILRVPDSIPDTWRSERQADVS